MYLEQNQERKKIYFYICLVATCCWIIFIFSMSLQPADVSSETSLGFAEWLVETFLPDQQEIFDTFSLEQIGFWHHILRKLAHFTEYTILGMGMAMTWMQKERIKHFCSIGAALCCIGVAATDETIQLFVPGRSGQIKDVMLDSCGAIFGILLIFAFWQLIKCVKKK